MRYLYRRETCVQDSCWYMAKTITILWSNYLPIKINSVQFSCSVLTDSLWPHEPQHTRPLCPSPTPGVHPNPCPLSGWCHPTISSSVVPFSSCPQSFPASGSFPMSHLFASGGQSTGVSASTSVLPMNSFKKKTEPDFCHHKSSSCSPYHNFCHQSVINPRNLRIILWTDPFSNCPSIAKQIILFFLTKSSICFLLSLSTVTALYQFLLK